MTLPTVVKLLISIAAPLAVGAVAGIFTANAIPTTAVKSLHKIIVKFL